MHTTCWLGRDPAVWNLAGRFLKLAEDRHVNLTASWATIYSRMLLRIEATNMRQLRDPLTGQLLLDKDGNPGWPMVLEHMIGLYYDGEVNAENGWIWRSFLSPKNFDRLLSYSVWQLWMSYQKEGEPVVYDIKPDERVLEMARQRREDKEERVRQVALNTEEIFAGKSREEKAAMFAQAMEETKQRQKERREHYKAEVKKGNVS